VLPLASQGELLGLLTLGPRLGVERRPSAQLIGLFTPLLSLSLIELFRSGPRVYELEYTREDRALLNTPAAQVAPALSVAQLVRAQQAQVRERERIEQELRTAQAIQRTFLPKDTPSLPGWQLIPYYQPAHEVGGDFYDFLLFEDGRIGLVIGDVTDKGIPAALVMTATCTMIRTAAQERESPGEVFARVNDLLYADIPAGLFVTCFYAVLDPTSGRLRFANAGHEPPYRRHNGSASELWATGMPLGMMPGTRYEEYEATLAPGETLLFYSDGLVEAHSASDEMFGFPRLQTVLEGYADGASHDGDAGASLIESVLSC
jgi:serine phosphatase RsbU (regulator of sigma subunit)